jgi:aspartyl/asparaginyl beta-hydroxylase (cupin superfamily)
MIFFGKPVPTHRIKSEGMLFRITLGLLTPSTFIPVDRRQAFSHKPIPFRVAE